MMLTHADFDTLDRIERLMHVNGCPEFVSFVQKLRLMLCDGNKTCEGCEYSGTDQCESCARNQDLTDNFEAADTED